MSAKKWLTIATFIFTIGALCIVMMVENNSIIYDVALATFGSALLGFIMSLIEYFAERKKAMEQFWQEGQCVLKELRKIKYFHCNEPCDLIVDCLKEESARQLNEPYSDIVQLNADDRSKAENGLKEWVLQNNILPTVEDEIIEEIWNRYYKSLMDKYRKTILAIIDSYRMAATIDLGGMKNAYGNMDFLFGNRKLRKKAYKSVYEKLREYRKVILDEKCHFDMLQNGERNLAVCIDKMLQLNRTFFTETKSEKAGCVSIKIYQTLFDDIDEKLETFRCSIYINADEEIIKRIPVCERCIPANEDVKINNEELGCQQ